MLEVLDVKLEEVERFIRTVTGYLLVHSVNNSFGRNMRSTPNVCGHCAGFPLDAHNVVLISTRALHWCDFEAKDVALLSGTLDVKWQATVLARDTCAALLVACLTNLIISGPRN